MITIIDYGMGNLRSVEKGFQRLKIPSQITSDIEQIKKAEKLILPGVGSFFAGMRNLKNMGLVELLNLKVIDEKTKILGICLGMQLLTNFSEEGNVCGLKWINGATQKFDSNNFNKNLKIPHMGWNTIKIKESNPLLKNCNEKESFYFVHSYHIVCDNENNVLATTEYGYPFISVVNKDNVYGTQFHPEKSHKQGLRILKNFAEL